MAGFALHLAGFRSTAAIEILSALGVQLLLFGIGLKLKPSTLGRREVWGTATVHVTATAGNIGTVLLVIGALGLPLARDLDLGQAVLLGFAFSFSSTVFAVQSLEEKNETGSLAAESLSGC